MNVEPELLNHPKYRRLKKTVGPAALEYLLRLWGHCASNKRGERWSAADAVYVECVCDWEGPAGELYAALEAAGFIERGSGEAGGIVVHDWETQNSFTVANWRRNPNGRPKQPTHNPRGSLGVPKDKTAHNPSGSHGNPKDKTAPSNGQDQATTKDESLASPPAPLGDPLRVSDKSEESEESEGTPSRGVPAEIPSKVEFMGAFMGDGIPEAFLEAKFAWFEGNNAWLDRNGRLKQWRVLVPSWWATDRGNWTGGTAVKPSAPAEGVWAIQKKIDAKADAIARHPANICGNAPVEHPTAEQEADLKKLRAELEELKWRLAS